jgi:nicotinamide mononucleotide adenylyltransferase
VKDVKKSDPDVRSFLKEMSEEILSNPFFDEIVECHLNPFTAEKRKQMIAEKLKQIKELD